MSHTATPDYIIDITSDDDEVDDVEIIEFRKHTKDLIENPQQPPSAQGHTTKKLADIQCPICFDDLTIATTTTCGHIFCLECIEQSISSSNARRQGSGRRGMGLCPLCRKSISFKDTIVLRMKVAQYGGKPELPPLDKLEELPIDKLVEKREAEDSGEVPYKRKRANEWIL